MNHAIKSLLIIFLFLSGQSFGQMNNFAYKRALSGITSSWHSIRIPDDVYGKIANDFSDIRIYGISSKNHIVEAPYIIRRSEEQNLSKEINFKLINRSNTNAGYYYTFEVPAGTVTNRLNLNLETANFDYKVRLEGSQDQLNWFTIIDKYRLVGLANSETEFSYTDISFSDSKYRYLRLFIPGSEDPNLTTASITLQQSTNSDFRTYKIEKIDNLKDSSQTIIELNLGKKLPVSRLRFDIKEKIDYFRPLRIEYAADSVQTEMGWIVNYATLLETDLSSLTEHDFHFNSTILSRLRIVIENDINQPLSPLAYEVSGFEHYLIARFTEDADYFLVYGSESVGIPTYDISKFADKIPKNAAFLQIGDEVLIGIETIEKEPLFKNKAWLWAILGTIILLLSYSMFRMMRSSK